MRSCVSSPMPCIVDSNSPLDVSSVTDVECTISATGKVNIVFFRSIQGGNLVSRHESNLLLSLMIGLVIPGWTRIRENTIWFFIYGADFTTIETFRRSADNFPLFLLLFRRVWGYAEKFTDIAVQRIAHDLHCLKPHTTGFAVDKCRDGLKREMHARFFNDQSL